MNDRQVQGKLLRWFPSVETVIHGLVIGTVIVLAMRSNLSGPLTQRGRHGAAFTAPQLASTFSWNRYNSTFVIALRHSCPYCVKSLPFYVRLQAAAATSARRTGIVFVTADDRRTVDQFLASGGITGAQIQSNINTATFGVDATPTILQVDSDGHLKRSWVGILSEEQQRAVLSLIDQNR